MGAFHLVNDMDFFLAAVNRPGRALLIAYATGFALFRVNIISNQFLARQGRASLFLDMGFIFISKVT